MFKIFNLIDTISIELVKQLKMFMIYKFSLEGYRVFIINTNIFHFKRK